MHPTLTQCECGNYFHASLERGMMCCSVCKRKGTAKLKQKIDELLNSDEWRDIKNANVRWIKKRDSKRSKNNK